MDVVVVEDNDDDARMTTMALRKIDPAPTITVVTDGAQAIEALTGSEAERPRVVLLDLKLPKVHGLEVLQAVKSDPEAREIPVLVLTSSDEPSDVARARELGCAEYLCKPVDWDAYMRIVCRSAARYLPPSVCKAL